MTLEQVLAKVTVGNDNLEQRGEVRRVVLETLEALGLLVSSTTGEVYQPFAHVERRR